MFNRFSLLMGLMALAALACTPKEGPQPFDRELAIIEVAPTYLIEPYNQGTVEFVVAYDPVGHTVLDVHRLSADSKVVLERPDFFTDSTFDLAFVVGRPGDAFPLATVSYYRNLQSALFQLSPSTSPQGTTQPELHLLNVTQQESQDYFYQLFNPHEQSQFGRYAEGQVVFEERANGSASADYMLRRERRQPPFDYAYQWLTGLTTPSPQEVDNTGWMAPEYYPVSGQPLADRWYIASHGYHAQGTVELSAANHTHHAQPSEVQLPRLPQVFEHHLATGNLRWWDPQINYPRTYRWQTWEFEGTLPSPSATVDAINPSINHWIPATITGPLYDMALLNFYVTAPTGDAAQLWHIYSSRGQAVDIPEFTWPAAVTEEFPQLLTLREGTLNKQSLGWAWYSPFAGYQQLATYLIEGQAYLDPYELSYWEDQLILLE